MWGVKRVVEDLSGAMERPLEDAQSAIDARWSLIAIADWWTSGEE